MSADAAPVVSQHRAVVAVAAEPIAAERRPVQGPIAVLPESSPAFERAIRDGGGEAAGLSPSTRAIVWLSSTGSKDLAEVLEANPQVGWVQLPWAGVDAFADVLSRFAGASTPLWTSAKGAYAQPVAEHALTLALALLRVIPTRVRATRWSVVPEGTSLYGLDVLIIEAGGIAIELTRLLAPFSVRVTVLRRSPDAFPGAERTLTSDRLLEALPTADVVFVAAAMTPGSSKLIGAAELATMKDSAILVNIARGGLVDTDALTSALAAGAIAGAGIDVTDPEPLPAGHPLWNEPRAIITPHSADTPQMTAPLLAERVRLNVKAFMGHGRFVGVVDPEAGY